MTRQRAVIFAVLLFFAVSGVSAQGQTLVLDGGTVIDGTGGPPIPDAVVVIEGTRIREVGTKGQVSYPSDARVINTEGQTILPGLIDSHIHLRDHMLPMFLPYGVTTIADTNNYTSWSLAIRNALEEGRIKGPRLFVSGIAAGGPSAGEGATLSSPSQEYGAYARNSSDGSVSPGVALQTVDDARAYVGGLLAKGVDMLKVDLDVTLDQLQAIVEEANRAGVAVVGHSENMRAAAEIGLNYMEHTDTVGRAILEEMGLIPEQGSSPESQMDTRLLDPLVGLMVEQGVYANPTLFVRWGASTPRAREWADAARELIQDPGLAFVPASVREPWTRPRGRADIQGFTKVAEFLRRFAQAGGKIAAGTDSGYMPGLSLHYEMQMMVDIGLSPMQAIQSATLWGAESIGEARDLGSVEAGKLADITVIKGNPLDNISATRNVRIVIKDGNIMDTAYDPGFVTPIPRPRDGNID
jgi:imidazolonepropionase-like amidohydrolase